MRRTKIILSAACISLAVSAAGFVWAQSKPAWREPEPLVAATIPTSRSEPPKRDEWSDAKPLEVKRRTTKARGCTAMKLREYVKVRCPYMTAGVRQFVGDTKDVELFVTPRPADGNIFQPPHGGEIVFPLRKGSSLFFQFFEIVEGYDGFGITEGVLVDVTWPESREAPSVVLR